MISKGSDITKFDVGDEVYGNIQDFNAESNLKQLGTVAEFIVVEETLVAKKPKNLTFEEAASLPLALQTAIEGFAIGGFKEGQDIFIVLPPFKVLNGIQASKKPKSGLFSRFFNKIQAS